MPEPLLGGRVELCMASPLAQSHMRRGERRPHRVLKESAAHPSAASSSQGYAALFLSFGCPSGQGLDFVTATPSTGCFHRSLRRRSKERRQGRILKTHVSEYSPVATSFGLLPDPERSTASFIASTIINGLILALLFILGAMARQVVVEHHYENTELIFPITPPPLPKVKLPPPPKIKPPEVEVACLRRSPCPSPGRT